jgi:hypothetical protein
MDVRKVPLHAVWGCPAVQLVADVDEVLNGSDVYVVDGGEIEDYGAESWEWGCGYTDHLVSHIFKETRRTNSQAWETTGDRPWNDPGPTRAEVWGCPAVQLVADVDEVLNGSDVYVVDGGEIEDYGVQPAPNAKSSWRRRHPHPHSQLSAP